MSAAQRSAIERAYYDEGLSAAEIAEQFGVSVSTAYRIARTERSRRIHAEAGR